MQYGRINLEFTNYTLFNSFKVLENPNYDELREIYRLYCEYKKFANVVPFFIEHYQAPHRDIIGYYDDGKLIAYSLLFKYPSENSVLADQFAWNYESPKLRLGIKSLENECQYYKTLGYKYLYLGEHSEYKTFFKGYELVSG
jgi:hypothetical protein